MRGSQSIFNNYHLLYYKCQEINSSCGPSYLDFPDWIKKNFFWLHQKNITDVFNML